MTRVSESGALTRINQILGNFIDAPADIQYSNVSCMPPAPSTSQTMLTSELSLSYPT